jgi:hypothetical protein
MLNFSLNKRKRPMETNWKKNLRKIPEAVKEKIRGFKGDRVVVACAKKVSLAELKDGTYSHLGLKTEDGEIVHPASTIPPSEAGRYSGWNVEGREIVHDDQPKEPKTYSWEAPNFGDWSKGSHTVRMRRMVYPRTEVPPRNLSIDIDILGQEVLDEEAFAVKFAVSQPLDPEGEDFGRELLFHLNLLQENVGHHGVFPDGAPEAKYLDSLFVDWEILPPGTEDREYDRVLSGVDGESPGKRKELTERFETLADLGPETYVQGRGGFRRYFGAKFDEDLVVFENTRYGNAIYVMYGDWRELSQKSRIELLENHEGEFDRIEHRDGWKEELTRLLAENGLGENGTSQQ